MKFFRKNYVIIFSIIIVFVFFISFMIIHENRPFGEYPFVSIDCFAQVYPFLSVLYDKIHNGENLLYFWNSGLGGNYLVTFFYYVSSPIYLLAMFFDKSHLYDFISISIIIKLALSAGSMGFYLTNKYNDRNNIIIIPLSCAYALNNFMLAYHYECMWLDSFVLFPIIMYGYEKLIKERKAVIYIISLAFAAYCNFYMIYIIALFLCIWFLLDNHMTLKEFIKNGVLFGGASIISAGIAAFPIVVSYLGVRSTHIQAEDFVAHEWYGNIFEVIRSQFIFSKLESIGDKLNQSNIYSGTFVIVLVCLYMFLSTVPILVKIKKLVLIIFLYISMNESILNFIWHSFHKPIHVPNRMGFILVFVLIDISLDTFENLNKQKDKKILCIGMILAELLPMISYYFVDFNSAIESRKILVISIIIIFLYGLLFFIYSNIKMKTIIICSFISIIMVSELLINSAFVLDKEVNYSDDILRDMHYFQDAVDVVEHDDSSSFYRSGFIYENMMNGNSVYGVNGVEIFSSIFPFGLLRFSKFNGLTARDNGIRGYGYPETIESILDEKYVYVYKENDFYSQRINYTKLYENDKVNVYKNEFELPLGYGVDKDVLNFHDYYINESYENENDMIHRMAGTDAVFYEILPEYSVDIKGGTINTINADYFMINSIINNPSERMVRISFKVPKNGEYFFSLILEKENNIAIVKNNSLINKMTCIPHDDIISVGFCEEGDNISIILSNEPNIYGVAEQEIITCRVAYFDNDAYKDFYEKLSNNTMSINTMKSDYINGSINLSTNQILFTSIPYDEGWKVYENGKEIKKLKLFDAFIGLDLGEGNHELQFKYKPIGMDIGAIISIVFSVIFIYFFVIKNLLKKSNDNIERQNWEKDE